MPITGKFLADFASFYDAVQKAEVSLRSFETGAGKVEASLNRMVDSFSGRKIISEAELAVRAVNDLGGASKLTENEQRRLNATVTEAIAKYKALGFEAPPDMVRLAEATRQVNTETGKIPASLKGITSSLSGLAGAFGIAFSVGAIVNFGKSVFDSASKIHDLALQLGISAEAVQGFKFAAEQSGSTLDAVGTAITKMNNNLSEGGKGTVQALTDAGLKFSDIRNMKPEDAFLAIADAVQKIPDPMKQSEVALQLFGRGAAELLPGMKEGFRGLSDSADKMTTDTVNSLEKAQDAWVKLADKVVIATGTIIAKLLEAPKFTREYADNVMKYGHDVADSWARMEEAAAKATRKDTNLPVSKLVDPKTQEELNRLEDAQKKAAAAARQHADAIRELADRLSGAALVREMRDLDAATTKLVASHKLDAAAKERVAEAATKLLKAGAPLTPQLFDLAVQFGALNPKVIAGAQGLTDFGQSVHLTVPEVYQLGEMLPKVTSGIDGILGVLPKADLSYQFKAAKPHVSDLTASLGDLSRAISDLAQIAGNTFGGMIRDLATLVGAADTANKSLRSIKDGIGDFKEGSTFQGILGMTTGILGMVSAAITAGKALANLFDRNKGRDLVVDFADTFGGFDKLHEKLLTLGEAGEALWIKLTQGVGRNNPKQAQAAIDEVTAALDEQERQQDQTTQATEEQAQATIETATQASLALDELGIRLKDNEAAWAEWSDQVTGYIRDLAAGIRSLPLPAPPGGVPAPAGGDGGGGGEEPGFASGTRGQYLDFGAGTRVTLHGRERVMTEAEGRSGGGAPIVVQLVADGRTLAEVTVPHIPDVVQSYGLA